MTTRQELTHQRDWLRSLLETSRLQNWGWTKETAMMELRRLDVLISSL